MKKIAKASFLALMIFAALNLIYSNLDSETLNYPLTFKFAIPGLFVLRSTPLPSGFVLIVSFSLGMIALAVIQGLPSLLKAIIHREQKKRIKALERELAELKGNERDLGETEEPAESSDDRPLP